MDDANPSHDRLLSLLRWLAAFEGVDDRKTGKVFSQNAEDGIIQHIFGRIGTESKTYVELGVQDGRECNTRHLRVKHNWTGLMIDGGFHKSEINLQRHFITTANVVSLLEKYGFRSSKKLDLLSIDTDCFDFWLTRARCMRELQILQAFVWTPFSRCTCISLPSKRGTCLFRYIVADSLFFIRVESISTKLFYGQYTHTCMGHTTTYTYNSQGGLSAIFR